jgi:T5SS/PEP-CTERM-associated repeat protein
MNRTGLILGLFLGIILASLPANAQYTADFQTNVISDVSSNWSGNYPVGSNTFADVLMVIYGGYISIDNGFIGYEINSSNNIATVYSSPIAGGGSWWNVRTNLFVGYNGAGNQLIIFDVGYASVYSDLSIGYNASSSNNSVLVTHGGSALFVSNALYVGNNGPRNSLAITNSGQVKSSYGYVGYNPSSSNNLAVVSGSGSVWSNQSSIRIGKSAAFNSLVISNAGRVIDNYGYLGGFHGSSNSVVVTGTNSVWNNSSDLNIGDFAGISNNLIIADGGKVISRDSYLNSSVQCVRVTGPGSLWSNTSALYMSGSKGSLIISNGGRVVGYSYVGSDLGSSSNSVLVTGTNSVWDNHFNSGSLSIGYYGSRNSLVISDGGIVLDASGIIGYGDQSGFNSVQVSGAGSIWSNKSVSLGGGISSPGFNSIIISNGGRVLVDPNSSYNDITGNSNKVVVTGPGSVWSNLYNLYIWGASNSFVISDGGQVICGHSWIGTSSNGSNNNVLVTGNGSVWRSGTLYFGQNNSSNNLAIRQGGQVFSDGASLGDQPSGFNNRVLVTDPGSLWDVGTFFTFGHRGGRNSLIISNSGEVSVRDTVWVGFSNSDSNSVCVTDNGVWRNNILHIGYQGASNSLVIAGGSVLATNLTLGLIATQCNNLVRLDSGTLAVTNATGDAAFEVRNGKLMLNGGVLQVDRFVMTNACAQFVRTGGTFIYGTALLDPNRDDDGDGIPNGWEQSHGRDPLNATDANADTDGDGQSDLAEFQAGTDPTNSASSFRITEITPIDEDILLTWTTVGGKKYAVQTVTGDYTNNFMEFEPAFVAPGTGESLMSVIHLGGATNLPGRFYRIRLVP